MKSDARLRAERWAARVFAWWTVLLPAAFRARAGAELVATFVERQRAARNARDLFAVWATEFGGVVHSAIGARRRDAWSRSVDRNLEVARGGEVMATRQPKVARFHDNVRGDLRFAARSIARRPGPAALATITFALGVAASVSMYSVVDAVLLQPLPFPEPDRLVSVYPTIPEWRTQPSLSDSWDRANFSYPEYTEWEVRQRSFASTAALKHRVVTLVDGGEPERIQIGRVSATLFPMLGVTPALGRSFTEDEDDRVDAVLLLSHALWQRRFGEDPSIVGKTVRLSDEPFTIVGVLPEDFQLTGFDNDAWSPLGGAAAENTRDDHSLQVIGRLSAATPLEAAEAETMRLLGDISPPGHFTQHGARLVARVADLTEAVRGPLMLLVIASGLLLAVSCASVAAVLLGIGIDRESELAVRAALGATRGRLAAQLLTESVALALVGGALGVLLTRVAIDGLILLAPAGIPRIDEVALDVRIAAFAIGVSALCGLIFGMVPALSLSGAGRRPSSDVRVTGGRARLQSAIVVAELALATVLLVCAGLLTRTMIALERVDPGFRADGVLTARVAYSWPRFQNDTSGARLTAYMDEIAAAVGGVPGVRDVAIAGSLPYSEDRASRMFVPEGYTPAPGELVVGEERVVSWNYMDLMGMRIVRGRGFTEADDRPGADPVIIVGEHLARRFWPDADAIGRTVGFWDMTFRVVGVVADVRDRDLTGDIAPQYYVPRRVRGQGAGSIILRVDGDPGAFASAVRARIWSVDPELPITSIMPLRERISDSIADQRYRMRLIGTFAVLSAIFALLGVYGVTSRWVARRTRELGIRMALGAERPRVLVLVLGRGVRLAVIGALAGVVASLAATRVLASFLFAVQPNDVLTLAAIALLLAFMSLLAAVPPARRATRVDPMDALRSN